MKVIGIATLALLADGKRTNGKKGNARLDPQGVHIGGGAFDKGTSEGIARWAIKKCQRKVCSVWPWAQCPTKPDMKGESNRQVKGPCCHKCWNKCPPYLARKKMDNRRVFAQGESRRLCKEEVWKFLEDDVECEKSRLKDDFMNEAVGLSNGMLSDAQDMSLEPDIQWYKCHGHRNSHCCGNACLNNPSKTAGKCGICNCNGACDYLNDPAGTMQKAARMGLPEALEAAEEVEEVPEVPEVPEEDYIVYETEPEY